MRLYGVVAALLLLIAVPVSVNAESMLKVTEMAVTTKVVKGKPIDSVRRISSASVSTLYCFTRLVSTDEDETVIVHKWFKDGALIAETELPVKGKRWRTFSQRPIDKSAAGNWRVEAFDADGNKLKTVEFKIN